MGRFLEEIQAEMAISATPASYPTSRCKWLWCEGDA
eukprot:COSAG01_NODE_778_length_13681_cov_15.265130_4_plen_36_part_00